MDLQTILHETSLHKQKANGHAEAGSPSPASRLPKTKVLRARSNALRAQLAQTRTKVNNLKAQSKERELKYRKLVSLCTRRPEEEVDQLLDTLTRAVESEKGELEIGRVRRFLGGVEGEVLA